MQGRFLTSAVITSLAIAGSGCDLAFGLDERTPATIDAPVDTLAGDAPPPEQCAYDSPVQVVFDPGIQPMHDYVDDGAGHAFVTGYLAKTDQVRGMALVDSEGVWGHDTSPRDQVGGFDGVRTEADPSLLYGMQNISAYRYVVHYAQLASAPTTWSTTGMERIDDRERVGNYRDIGGKRIYVTTQVPSPIDQNTRLVLRVRDGENWNIEDRMSAINTAQIPDLGVLTRDGLTLIYSARTRNEVSFDLFISVRSSLSANFPVGTRLDALSTDADEVEPWIAQTCDRLSFRRGLTFLSGQGQTSTIWRAIAP